MAIPQVYHTVLPQDFTITPIVVNKRYTISKENVYSGSLPFTSSGYKIWTAVYNGEKLKLGTTSQNNYSTNSFDGSYQHIIWKFIDAQYYRFPYDAYGTFEHPNERFTYKFLNYSASIFVCPQQDFGEGILPGSVYMENADRSLYFRDDGNGNLYDISQDQYTSSFDVARHHLMAHWDFKDEFRRFKQLPGTIDNDAIQYRSFNIPHGKSTCINTRFNIQSGLFNNICPEFSQSLVYTEHIDDFNFSDDFTITFWLKAPVTQSLSVTEQCIISKCGIVRKQVYGNNKKVNSNGDVYYDTFESSSLQDESLSIYPFKITFGNYNHPSYPGRVIFRRSNGIDTLELTATHNSNIFQHFALVKTGSLFAIFKNGLLATSTNDTLTGTYNHHAITFASSNFSKTDALSGSIGEIRMYNVGLDEQHINPLQDTYIYGSPVIGNVFYKKGTIVISPKYISYPYLNFFDSSDNWFVQYRNTHTIYQWETVVRVPKGSFNLSQNPTALKNAHTDLLRNEFTGSNPNVDLFPYCTSVGLYNDDKELLAVAKLSQPLKIRNDVDVNIICRWDT